MRARVLKEFPGVIDGSVYPVTIAVGAVIDGDLAATAVAGKLAEEIKEEAAPSDAAAPKKPGKSKA